MPGNSAWNIFHTNLVFSRGPQGTPVKRVALKFHFSTRSSFTPWGISSNFRRVAIFKKIGKPAIRPSRGFYILYFVHKNVLRIFAYAIKYDTDVLIHLWDAFVGKVWWEVSLADCSHGIAWFWIILTIFPPKNSSPKLQVFDFRLMQFESLANLT